MDTKMSDLFDTLIFYTDGFAVRLNGVFRLKILDIFKSSDICYKVIKRTLKTADMQENTGKLTSFCIITKTQFCL